jgi:hypothetical protein
VLRHTRAHSTRPAAVPTCCAQPRAGVCTTQPPPGTAAIPAQPLDRGQTSTQIHKGRCCSTIHWGLLTALLPACACAIRRHEINGARQATHGPHGPAAAFCAHATLNDSTNRASGADPGLPQALRAAKGCASSSCAACSQPPLTGTRCECCRARRAAVQRLHRHIPNSMPLPCHTSLGSLVQLST